MSNFFPLKLKSAPRTFIWPVLKLEINEQFVVPIILTVLESVVYINLSLFGKNLIALTT